MVTSIRKTGESTYVFSDFQDNTLDDVLGTEYLHKIPKIYTPKYGLGSLDRLPSEIIHLILVCLDIKSLTDFCFANKSARLTVNSIPQYKRILCHAPATIRGSLNIGTAHLISCVDLYKKLSTAECDKCGDFGGYLYLVTCRRVCYLCFTKETDYLPILRKNVIRAFGLRSEDLAHLPHMRSLPGYYSTRRIKCRQAVTLFDFSAAQRAGVALHGTIDSMESFASEQASRKRASQETGTVNRRTPRPEVNFDGQSSNPRRFMGIVCAPFFSAQTALPDWGSHCIACKPHHYCRPLHWRRKYTKDSFQEHLKECGRIVGEEHIMPCD